MPLTITFEQATGCGIFMLKSSSERTKVAIAASTPRAFAPRRAMIPTRSRQLLREWRV
jgi:hypothetical protein